MVSWLSFSWNLSLLVTPIILNGLLCCSIGSPFGHHLLSALSLLRVFPLTMSATMHTVSWRFSFLGIGQLVTQLAQLALSFSSCFLYFFLKFSSYVPSFSVSANVAHTHTLIRLAPKALLDHWLTDWLIVFVKAMLSKTIDWWTNGKKYFLLVVGPFVSLSYGSICPPFVHFSIYNFTLDPERFRSFVCMRSESSTTDEWKGATWYKSYSRTQTMITSHTLILTKQTIAIWSACPFGKQLSF